MIKKIEISEAMKIPGVKAVITHNDIPGAKLWGDIVYDEEIFAIDRVHHYGKKKKIFQISKNRT